MEIFITIFSIFFALRLVTLVISIRNEKKIIAQGGIQHGKFNSMLLTLAHIAFYFSCLFEVYISKYWQFDGIAKIGFGLLLFAYIILYYIILFCVIYQLRNIWTLKIYILPKHKINTSFLFKRVKHPNYFLNIIPELIGMAILCKAFITFCVLFPVYLVLLLTRIKQEEKAMQHLM